jgi:YjjG family noncanonical pyrimidine nucleotidase
MMKKAIFLDIDNTLLDFDKCAHLSMKSSFEDFGIEFEEWMFDTFERVNLSIWRSLEKGYITKPQLFKIRWATVLAALDINFDGIEMETRFKHYINTVAITIDYAKEILEYLSKKYKLYATSNATYEQQISRLKNAGFDKYFSGYFISEKVGFEKPSKEFFDGCTKDLPYQLDELILIGDSPTADIKGGAQYGIDTIWFDHRGEKLPDIVTPTYTVNHLKEIENIL